MNKKKPEPTKGGAEAAPTPAPKTPVAESKPAKHTAMKLPEGVAPKGAAGPRQGPGWDRNASGRPQRDAARRAGKSRKVH